jgi:hypothetical protein
MPCRTSKSSTLLHHQVHSFMAHGVDPLVEIGGQQTQKGKMHKVALSNVGGCPVGGASSTEGRKFLWRPIIC